MHNLHPVRCFINFRTAASVTAVLPASIGIFQQEKRVNYYFCPHTSFNCVLFLPLILRFTFINTRTESYLTVRLYSTSRDISSAEKKNLFRTHNKLSCVLFLLCIYFLFLVRCVSSLPERNGLTSRLYSFPGNLCKNSVKAFPFTEYKLRFEFCGFWVISHSGSLSHEYSTESLVTVLLCTSHA